jgi:hypothetical protein
VGEVSQNLARQGFFEGAATRTPFFPVFSRFFACVSARYMVYNVRMTDGHSKLRQRIRRAQDAAGRILQQLLRQEPLTPGSLYLQKRRCGKPNCRCARGQFHTA